jgi:hypothetical protein
MAISSLKWVDNKSGQPLEVWIYESGERYGNIPTSGGMGMDTWVSWCGSQRDFNRFRDAFPAACCVLPVCCLAAPIPRSLLRGFLLEGILSK